MRLAHGKGPRGLPEKSCERRGSNWLHAANSFSLPFPKLNYWDDGRKSVWSHDSSIKLNKKGEQGIQYHSAVPTQSL